MTRWWRFAGKHDLFLPLGAVIGLIWANTYAVSYFETAQALAFWVNDVGLAFAVAFIAQEAIEAAMPGGTLYPWRSATVAVIAGAGGSMGAVAVYAAHIYATDERVLLQGWPIVCSVDLLFSVAIARWIFRRRVPPFLLVAALTTDVIGLALVSGRHSVAQLRPAAAALIVPALGISVALRRLHVQSIWPYLSLAGPLWWMACYATGIHPALSLLPVVPFLVHAPRDVNASLQADSGPHRSPTHFEQVFRSPMKAIAFLFGLANGGVLIHGFGTGTWAVITASLVGRPAGILGATGLAIATGLHLPRAISWRTLVVIAFIVTPGLTFGVFLATTVFAQGPLLIETKIGAIATALGALFAIASAWLLRVGRFSLAAEGPLIRTRVRRGAA
jgi:NhaA family Na+:H+ antiporter